MEMIITGRNGALTTFRIFGDAAKIQETAEAIASHVTFSNEICIEGECSKNEIPKISALVAPGARADRYVTTLADAEMNNLNHGRSWVCSGTDVDKNSLSPECEGEQICYVYQ